MNICVRQGRLFKTWLQETNRFDHVNTLSTSEQRIATRIYRIVLTVAIIVLLIYTSVSIQQHTVTIQSPSSEDFQHLQSLPLDTFSCPCRTITISHRTFIKLEAEFHPVCSSQFVTRTWSDALFFDNASLYLPVDARSTLSAQYQLLSSLWSLARQIVDDELRSFLATQFISSQVISNHSLHIQVDALTTAFKNSISSSLLRSLELIRQTSVGNQVVSAISSSSKNVLFQHATMEYDAARLFCDYNIITAPTCTCYKSYTCKMPVGFYNMTMPTSMLLRCSVNVSTDRSLTILEGLYAGCIPLESLLSSSLAYLYDIHCLETLQQYMALNMNLSVLTLSNTGQFNKDSTMMEIIGQLFVHQWKLNVSYDSFFTTCAPVMCSYTYSKAVNFAYIAATLAGFYGGLTIALECLILLALKYWHNRKTKSTQIHEGTSMFIRLRKICLSLKKAVIELNLFAEKEQLTIDQQRLTTRVFLALFSSAILILIIFSMLNTQIYTENIYSPTQKDFEKLQMLYSVTLSCPCSQIIIPHKQFIQLRPNFHTICSSEFISEKWINALIQTALSTGYLLPTADFLQTAITHFFQINSFCHLANQTIEDLLAIFNEIPLINRYALSTSRLHLESNELVTMFQQLTEDLFSLQIKFIQSMSHGNQLMSGVFTNTDLTIINSSTEKLTTHLLSYNPVSFNRSNCSCILDTSSCATPSQIFKNSDLYSRPIAVFNLSTFLYGCYAIDSLFLSTFECFYNQSCLNALQPSIPYFNMTALNILETSQYTPNTNIDFIVKNVLVDKWISSISFEQYYSACAPQQCSYTYEKRADFIYLFTILLSLFGGLNVALRILSPFLTSLITKLFRPHHYQSQMPFFTRLRNLISFLRSLPLIIWKNLVSLNLFARHGQQINEQRIYFQRYTTRLYLCSLISTLVILGIYQTISIYKFSQTINNPSPRTFEHLYNQHTDMLSCPCNEVSTSYSRFIDIEYTFHPICLSNFLTQTWFNSIANINKYPYSDFRSSAISHFQILNYLCQLANATVVNSRSSFLTKKFFGTIIISSNDFNKQIQTDIQIFQSNTRSNYIRSLQLIRDTTSGNALMTAYTSAWRFELSSTNAYSVMPTFPMTYNDDDENHTCSCGTDGDCSQAAAVYLAKETIMIPGIRVGCYPLNAVLQSTLQCLYDQNCIDLLKTIFNISKSYTVIENTTFNQFNINTTIYSLADQLFINNWYTNISYEKYFHICAASTCTYSYSQRANFIYVFTTLIGLYGGLSISLRLLSPIFVNLFKRMAEKLHIFHRNEILPTIS